MTERVVLDTSALLALFWGEPGAARVAACVRSGLLSTVNAGEFFAKLSDRGVPAERGEFYFGNCGVTLAPFDLEQARVTGALRAATRAKGLSLGDRACLALALTQGLRVLTADAAWAELELGVNIELIR